MLRKKNACKQQAVDNSCHYEDLLEQDRETQSEHSSGPTSKVKPATENDYVYAEVQDQSEQLGQFDASEATYAEIKENEPHIYQHPRASKKALPEPTEAGLGHMYGEVTKERKLPDTASEDMSKPPQAAQTNVPPAKPAPYKSKTSL